VKDKIAAHNNVVAHGVIMIRQLPNKNPKASNTGNCSKKLFFCIAVFLGLKHER
jgi:hypothetical protein